MVSCSYKGSFNDVAFRSGQQEHRVTTWDSSAVETVTSEPIQPTSYHRMLAEEHNQLVRGNDLDEGDYKDVAPDYNLADDVSVWSDFLRVEIAPKSVFEVSSVLHSDDAGRNQLGNFEEGVSILEDVYEVSIRYIKMNYCFNWMGLSREKS